MNSFVDQSRLLHQLPVIVNVMNIPEPAKGEPTLLSLDHVVTMFHELGTVFTDYSRTSNTHVSPAPRSQETLLSSHLPFTKIGPFTLKC